ncbi:hypothetical protein POM88_051726 [Heracleum sosnowskyi]|uniref:Uncharacterized protein n=1 Tax=Heracleum sosnowskyi TaxID=360622 RepID=A0AAD8M1J2_9APIA|nr:hypothetical protein POM88_051726 [Heracleum sosnowskyi]
MPPKNGKGKGRGRASSGVGRKNLFEEFDPKKIGKEDRFVFNLSSEDNHVDFNFFIFIIQLRSIAALGGSKFTGEEFDHKLCLGDAKSYENPFMIVSVCFEGLYGIGFLIYKPIVTSVGFCINEEWWRVRDFSEVTNYKFKDSNQLLYDSSYRSGVPKRYSFHIFQNAIMNLFKSRDEASFRSLCVILCETMKSDEILRVVSGSFGKDENEVRKEVELSTRHTSIISSWIQTSVLWYLYDMGFKWDPLHLYPDLVFQDADACSKSLALAIKADKKFEYYVERLRNLSPEKREKTQRRPIQMKGF